MAGQSRAAVWILACMAMAAAAGGPGTNPRRWTRRPTTPVSPYFFVDGDGATEQLPLKATEVDVTIAGVIADVTVTQRYRNDGKRADRGEYVFPARPAPPLRPDHDASANAASTAQIREKEQARTEYEAAKEAGKTASLLEQHRPTCSR